MAQNIRRTRRGPALPYVAGVLFPLFLCLLPAVAGAVEPDLSPRRDQAQLLGQSLLVLERSHYAPLDVNDAFAAQTVAGFLDALDPAHLLFLRSDVEEFQREYGDTLDDALKSQDLAPAFAMFERFLERRQAQLDFLIERAERDPAELVLDGQATLERDRRQAPWLNSLAEARELWGRLYENDVLTARLEGRSSSEIASALQRRYAVQRDQLEDIDSDDVFSLFLNVVAGEFDPHTNYFPPMGAENFEMSMALSFEGVGAVLSPDGDYARIERLIPGGPAERSGELQPTDRIAAVGQGASEPLTDVVGWRLDDVVALIRGPRGSTVRLQVLPGEDGVGAARVVALERDEVELEDQAARSEVLELSRDGVPYRIGVITLPTFYLDFEAARRGDPEFRSSTRDTARLLFELREQDVDGVVLDLRDNGGGALSEAQSLAGLFLGPGPVVQVRDPDGRMQVLESGTRAVYDGPLVVLVNRLSASASEIVAAAIQDRGRGVVVGSRTFGKGTVQGLVPLGDAQLKVTQAKFYRLSGASTQHLGVEPDVLLPATYDPDEIGESALPAALAFDRVRSLRGLGDRRIAGILPYLQAEHERRAGEEPDLVAARARLDATREFTRGAEISLNEGQRRHEREALEARLVEIENARRSGLGLAPVASLEDVEVPTVDVLLGEAARIAVDLTSLVRPGFAPRKSVSFVR